MSVVMIGLTNNTAQPIAIGAPTAIVGNVLVALAPDPLTAGASAAGMVDSPAHQNELEVNYNPQITTATGTVTLTIDIWIQGTVFQKFFVASTDPLNYPIQGEYSVNGGPDAFAALVTVG